MTASPPQRRGRFALVAFAALAVFLGLWWINFDVLIGLVRPLVEFGANLFDLAASIDANTNQGWTVWTGLTIISGPRELLGGTAGVVVHAEQLHYLSRSFPLFLALMAAPPYDRGLARQFLIGLAALGLLFVLSALAVINCALAILINHEPSPADPRMAPPNFLVRADRYDELGFFLACLDQYLAMMMLPLIAPVVVWLALKPRALAMLLGRA